MPSDTIKAIHARYSCRGFTDKMPSDEDLKTLTEAAIAAPSGMNRQLWRIIVVKNKELISDMEAEGLKNLKASPELYSHIMSRSGNLFYNAPCIVVIPIGKTEPPGAELFDCGIIAENIALAATSIGVDNLICGITAFCFAGDRNDEFKRRLGFPDGFEIGIGVLLGHASEVGGKPHELDYGKICFIE